MSLIRAKAAETFPLSILMCYRQSQQQRWSVGQWIVGGVVTGQHGTEPHPVHADAPNEVLWPGFKVQLFIDAAESYYCNLMADKPSVFVLCRHDEADDQLTPCLATVSYDEATSYMEVDEHVFSVPMPPEMYRWLEAFVLKHYVPEEKKKRKRVDWSETNNEQRG